MPRRKRDGSLDGGAYSEAQREQEHTEAVMSNRANIIRDACREIAALEAERASISESIREIKQKKIKGDLGMKLADFSSALRLYKLEREDRDEFFDTLRETFEALGQGDQLDFIDALQGEQANDDHSRA